MNPFGKWSKTFSRLKTLLYQYLNFQFLVTAVLLRNRITRAEFCVDWKHSLFLTLYDSVHLHDVRFSFKIELWKFEGSTRKYTNGIYLFVDILWPDQIACGDE